MATKCQKKISDPKSFVRGYYLRAVIASARTVFTIFKRE